MSAPPTTAEPAPVSLMEPALRDAPVALLSPGRSGSTLLQALLNTHPELTIWGEHRGILNPLLHALDQVSSCEWIDETMRHGDWLLEPVRHVDEQRWSAWDGSFSRDDFHQHLRQMLDRLFRLDQVPTRRWGFKEIRYSDIDRMRQLVKLYPQTQFLLLLRNPAKACTSFVSATMRNRGMPDSDVEPLVHEMAEGLIRPFFHFVPKALQAWPECTTFISFEQLASNPHGALTRIGKFLGLWEGFEPDAINRIMSVSLVSERARTEAERLLRIEAAATHELAQECEWYSRLVEASQPVDQAQLQANKRNTAERSPDSVT